MSVALARREGHAHRPVPRQRDRSFQERHFPIPASSASAGVTVQSEDSVMLRRVGLLLCLCAFGLSLGCGGDAEKSNNPNNLEYSKEGPPPRDGVKGAKKK